MIVKSKIGNNFERKRGFIITTAQGQIDLHGLITACQRKPRQSVNVHTLLGDIYTKIGDITKAINEYMQAIKQCAEGESLDNRIAIYEKMSRILQCLSDVNKGDLPKQGGQDEAILSIP
ncbi:MAG TPA: hypothetical protein EYP60_02490 [bacterium (Candidatus Stahlbacteria)]|nr:hypothetical protein [Candidatus Stahlbacteria bacterium]